MEAALKLVLKNQILRLAFKGVLLTVLIFSYTYSLDFMYLALFVLALLFFYFRPGVQNGKFLIPLVLGASLVFIIPSGLALDVYIWFSLALGILFALLVGLKNLIFIKKTRVYSAVNLCLASIFSIFFFYGFLDIGPGRAPISGSGVSSMILFGAVFFLFKDLYVNGGLAGKERANLIGALTAFIVLEVSWALSVLPLTNAWRSFAAILAIFGLHYVWLLASKSRSATL